MSRGPFDGRVVAVTGAATGIGRAVAERFARAGARVALLDRDADGCAALAARLTGVGETFHAALDVTDEAACRRVLEAVAARFGGLDVLVNNAGITHRSRFVDTDAEVHRRVMEVNYFGSLHCTQAALPTLLERRGTIIVLSSVAGFAPLLGRSGYCASKHALHGLFETLRCELRDRGVHVMLVCPGFTATHIERDALGAHGRRSTRSQSRVGRQARPEQVAEAVYRGACRRRRILVLSPVGRVARLLVRVAPAVYERAMTRSLREELGAEDGRA